VGWEVLSRALSEVEAKQVPGAHRRRSSMFNVSPFVPCSSSTQQSVALYKGVGWLQVDFRRLTKDIKMY